MPGHVYVDLLQRALIGGHTDGKAQH